MFETGTIKKAHGIKGEVVYLHESDHPLSENQLLMVRQRNGDIGMYRISRIRKAGPHTDSSFFVLFSGIDNRSQAEELKGLRVFSSTPPPEPDQTNTPDLDVFDCVSFSITDLENGISGIVTDVIENPAHPLIEAGINELSVLIPNAEAYIVHIDFEKRHIEARNLHILTEFAEQELKN